MIRLLNSSLIAIALATLTIGCSEKPVVDERQAIGIMYVAPEKLDVREKPDPSAAVLSTYQQGETVTILAKQNGWVELRMGGEQTGWVRESDLSAEKPEAAQQSDSTTVRFRKPPAPVYSQRGAKGVIVYEATVSTSGTVISVKTLRNTTGSQLLEAQNRAQIQQATFYPMVVGGRPQSFVYEYRVEY